MVVFERSDGTRYKIWRQANLCASISELRPKNQVDFILFWLGHICIYYQLEFSVPWKALVKLGCCTSLAECKFRAQYGPAWTAGLPQFLHRREFPLCGLERSGKWTKVRVQPLQKKINSRWNSSYKNGTKTSLVSPSPAARILFRSGK